MNKKRKSSLGGSWDVKNVEITLEGIRVLSGSQPRRAFHVGRNRMEMH